MGFVSLNENMLFFWLLASWKFPILGLGYFCIKLELDFFKMEGKNRQKVKYLFDKLLNALFFEGETLKQRRINYALPDMYL